MASQATTEVSGDVLTLVLGEVAEPAFPLRVPQEEIWVTEQFDPVPGRYTVPLFLRLAAPLERNRLAAALRQVAEARHALRTVVVAGSSGARQRVHRAQEVRHHRTMLSLPTASPDPDDVATAAARRDVPLTATPPWRLEQYELPDGVAVLAFLIHHAMIDGWAVDLLLSDLAAAYQGVDQPRPDRATGPQLLQLDNDRRDRVGLAQALDQLAERCAPARPWRPPSAVADLTGHGHTLRQTLPAPWVDHVRELATASGVTFYTACLTTFGELMARYGDQKSMLVGVPLHGRADLDSQQTIGMFARVQPVRLDAAGVRTFQQAAADTAAALFDVMDFDFVPLTDLTRRIRDAAGPAAADWYAPTSFELVFGMHEITPVPSFGSGGAPIRVWTDTATAKFTMTWSLLVGDQVVLEVEYDQGMFDQPMVRAMIDAWQTLLANVTDRHQSLAGTAAATIPAARTGECNPTPQLSTPDIASAVLRQAERSPQAVALIDGHGAWDYATLIRRAYRWRNALVATGGRPGDRVIVVAHRDAETVAAMLGCLLTGAAYVPVDPTVPPALAGYYATDSAARFVLGEPGEVADLGLTGLRTLAAGASASSASPPEPAVPARSSRHLAALPAYLIYTSGSTGHPKGVMVPHRAVVSLCEVGTEVFALGSDDVWTAFHSFAFDFSIWEIWVGLMTGGRVVVVDRGTARDPAAFLHLLESKQVTILNQTPSAFRNLVDVDSRLGPDARLPHLRHAIFGGESIDLSSTRRWRTRHPHVRMWNMFGITETTVHVTVLELDGRQQLSTSPIGAPLPRAAVTLLDQHGLPVPPYLLGEIYVSGHGVAYGYYNRPALTAERFVPDPHSPRPGARAYRSGDQGWLDGDGRLHYVGRTDSQVKIRGHRIELGEIEAAVRDHGRVVDCVVLVDRRDDDRTLLKVYVVTPDRAQVSDLRAYLARRLPPHMVPHNIYHIGAIPLTRNGKIDEAMLRSMTDSRSGIAAESAIADEPPDDLERNLAAVWQQVLGVPEVDVNDNFFTVGGDSISSVQVVGRAAELGIELSVRDLFEGQTVRGVAARVHRYRAGHADQPARQRTAPFELITATDRERLPADVVDAYPLTSLQQAMVYHMESDPDALPYHNVDSFRLRCVWRPALLRQAVDECVARHPVLRTSFDFASFSEPLQLVHASAHLPVTVEDLRQLSAVDQRRHLEELFIRERRCPFDLSRSPFFRFFFSRLTDDEFQWTLTEHHAIQDGWSLNSMFAEILDRYLQLADDPAAPPLPPPRSMFRDYVAAELHACGSEPARRYWERLRGRPTVPLPLLERVGDAADGRHRSHHLPPGCFTTEHPGRFRYLGHRLPAELGQALHTRASALGLPLKSLLLSAHLAVLAVVCATDTPTSGLTFSGRMDEIDGDVCRGLFLNTVPLRLTLGDTTWATLCRQAFDAEREIMPFRRYPLFEIVRQVGDVARFDVSFVYNHFRVLSNTLRAARVKIVDEKVESYMASRYEPTSFSLVTGVLRSPVDDTLLLTLDYDHAHLDLPAVSQLHQYYLRAFTSLAGDPDRRWQELAEPGQPSALAVGAGVRELP